MTTSDEELEAAIWRAMTNARVTCPDPLGFVDDIRDAARRYSAGDSPAATAYRRRTPKAERGKVTRTPGTSGIPHEGPWLDQPAGSLPESAEYSQGSITPAQQRAIMKLYGGQARPMRLATISELAGRTVTSTNDLSYVEAQRVLASGKAAK